MGILDRLLFWRHDDPTDGGIEAMDGYRVEGCFTGPAADLQPDGADDACVPEGDVDPVEQNPAAS